ncbi:hypothetical protein ACS0TY_013896 [Phlomoides rotata]
MKLNPRISSSQRKSQKAHFSAPSSVRRVIMSAPFSGNLRSKYNIRSMPIRKDSEVQVIRGTYKGRDGKVVQVYHKKCVIHIKRITRENVIRSIVNVSIHPSRLLSRSLASIRIENHCSTARPRAALLRIRTRAPSSPPKILCRLSINRLVNLRFNCCNAVFVEARGTVFYCLTFDGYFVLFILILMVISLYSISPHCNSGFFSLFSFAALTPLLAWNCNTVCWFLFLSFIIIYI